MNGWKSRPGSEEPVESDWWVASLDGGAARSAGFADVLRRQRLLRFATDPGVWTRDGGWIVFAGSTGDSSSLYRVRVSSQSQIVGDAERITFGTGIETKPALSANGQLVLATEVFTSHLWSVPADTNRGQVTGPMAQLTRDATEDMWPQISEDGRRVAYFSVLSGRGRVLVRDSEASAPKQLAPGWDVDLYVALVRGGTRVVFSGEAASGEKGVYAFDIGSGVPALLKKDAVSWGASEDGRYFLEYSLETETGPAAFDTETRREFRMASHESSRVLSPQFSRDGGWVVLHVANSEMTRQVFVLPFHEGRETPRGEWIPITDGKQLDRDPKWSPDGNLVYFLADREGARGIYAQKLDPATKHPVGRPFEVMMFRRTQRNMMFPNSGQSSPAVARDKLVFPLREVQASIWLTQMP
jgi:Tol biopolymer transport system component